MAKPGKALCPRPITFEGREIDFRPGDTLPLNDACEALRFINAAEALGDGGIQEKTPEGFQAMAEECRRIGGGPGGAPPHLQSGGRSRR